MLRINKFKLIGDDGVKGISVSGIEHKIKDGVEVLASISGLELKIPVPSDLSMLVQRLKKYLLEIMNYWESDMDLFYKAGTLSDYDKSFDKTMYDRAHLHFSRVKVTGVNRKDASYQLTGKIITVNNQIIGFSTPLISFKDGYQNFDKMQFGCEKCLTEVSQFIVEKKLRMMGSRQYMMELWKDDQEKVEDIKGMNEQELTDLQIKDLERKGAFVMMAGDIEEKPKEIAASENSSGNPADIIPETSQSSISEK